MTRRCRIFLLTGYSQIHTPVSNKKYSHGRKSRRPWIGLLILIGHIIRKHTSATSRVWPGRILWQRDILSPSSDDTLQPRRPVLNQTPTQGETQFTNRVVRCYVSNQGLLGRRKYLHRLLQPHLSNLRFQQSRLHRQVRLYTAEFYRNFNSTSYCSRNKYI